jgi:murein DD-endopeptidase MepM/ murein hydrolase activator NlpD
MTAIIRYGKRWSRKYRKGAASVEFVTILPLSILLFFVLWQLVLLGAAVMDTHAAVRDAVKIASTTGDEELAETEGMASFGEAKSYILDTLTVVIENGEAKVEAETSIPILFMTTSPFTYSTSAEAPVLNVLPNVNGEVLAGGRLLSPVNLPPGCDINCYSGHTGQDFPGPEGTPVVAAEAGRVSKVQHLGNRSYGSYIVIDHGGGLQTLYAHMYEYQVQVRTGDIVERGQVIGAVGNNGNSSGPHLHFEVLIGGRPVDPIPFLR